MGQASNYTKFPRPLLWLIREGTLETDAGPIKIDSYYLSKSPVTNQQYEACDPDHRRSANHPRDDDPVTDVTLEQVRAYCRWYAEVSRKPMRLPGEAEWEYARVGAEAFGLHGLGQNGIAEWIDDDRGIVLCGGDPRKEVAGSEAHRRDLGFRLVRSMRMK